MTYAVLAGLLGGLSILYFIGYALMIGLTNRFTYFWIFFGIGLLGVSGMILWFQHRDVKIPVWLRAMLGIGTVVIVLFLAWAEIIIISYGAKQPTPGADYVIVLGAQVKGRQVSHNLAKRLDAAFSYAKDNPSTTVVVSGGKGTGEDVTEASAMRAYLEQKGLEGSRILEEDRSTNTDENIRFCRQLVDMDQSHVVIVTNNFHVYRGIRIAKKQGMTNVEGLGAAILPYSLPNMYLREGIAVIKYKLCGQI